MLSCGQPAHVRATTALCWYTQCRTIGVGPAEWVRKNTLTLVLIIYSHMLDPSESWFSTWWLLFFRLFVYVRSSSKSLCPTYHCPTSASQLSWQWRLACLGEKLWLFCIGVRPFYWYLEKWWVMSLLQIDYIYILLHHAVFKCQLA